MLELYFVCKMKWHTRCRCLTAVGYALCRDIFNTLTTWTLFLGQFCIDWRWRMFLRWIFNFLFPHLSKQTWYRGRPPTIDTLHVTGLWWPTCNVHHFKRLFFLMEGSIEKVALLVLLCYLVTKESDWVNVFIMSGVILKKQTSGNPPIKSTDICHHSKNVKYIQKAEILITSFCMKYSR